MTTRRRYHYVGPPEIAALASASASAPGAAVRSISDLDALGPSREPFTYVVDVDGVLRLAPRRSEHVACAGGGEVLAAGEIARPCGQLNLVKDGDFTCAVCASSLPL